MDIVLFIGAPGAGKSTFYGSRFSTTHALVSGDRFRNNGNPSRRQRTLILEAVRDGRSIVVDNTHPRRVDREEVLAIAREHGIPVDGYVFESTAKECLARNAQRTGKARVPPVAIYSWLKRYEPPTPDEGYRALFHVRALQDGSFSVEP